MKKEKNKPAFVPDSQEQTDAVTRIQEFITAGPSGEFFTLQGKAGTGKTTLIQEALAPFLRRQIIIGALSHKAKLVLANKVKNRFGKYAVSDETIASMLGMTMNQENGKFFIDSSIQSDPPIQSADILIVDEASMVNEEALKLIMQQKPNDCKVIFVGDKGQLPPIRESARRDIDTDADSPTFTTDHSFTLMTRVRQGEGSPILPYADLFWNNSQSVTPVLDPAPTTARKSVVSEKGSLVFAKSQSAILSVLPLYERAVETGNFDLVRTVVYKNTTRKFLNKKIRSLLFDVKAEAEYIAGDLIMFVDNYGFGVDRISNSTEVQVKRCSSLTLDEWKAFELSVTIDAKPRLLHVLAAEEMDRRRLYLSQLAETAQAKVKGLDRKNAWAKFWKEKQRFAPVEHGYAITAHKAQGSTYDVSLVADADIMNVGATSNKSKSQAIYTGITRAKHLAIILDGANHEGWHMEEAIAMLDKQQLID